MATLPRHRRSSHRPQRAVEELPVSAFGGRADVQRRRFPRAATTQRRTAAPMLAREAVTRHRSPATSLVCCVRGCGDTRCTVRLVLAKPRAPKLGHVGIELGGPCSTARKPPRGRSRPRTVRGAPGSMCANPSGQPAEPGHAKRLPVIRCGNRLVGRPRPTSTIRRNHLSKFACMLCAKGVRHRVGTAT